MCVALSLLWLLCQSDQRKDQHKTSVPSSLYLQVPLLIPAKQLFTASVTVILLVPVTHRKSCTERNEATWIATDDHFSSTDKTLCMNGVTVDLKQTCKFTHFSWPQSVCYSTEGPFVVVLRRLPGWQATWRVESCRLMQIWLCWTAPERGSLGVGPWGLTAGKI